MAQANCSRTGQAPAFEQQVRKRIDSLSYLPTAVGVAMKFMELGRNPDADPSEYAKVISSDSSLCSKLLGLANSSWFGVRNKVTRPQTAVNLLGLGTVRTLAISYCLSGLHNELKLSADESRMFWAGSLCKAVAARTLASHLDADSAEEAFAVGLFQDFAMPVMYAVAREPVMALLQDRSLDSATRLAREGDLFRLDHAALGRVLAQKLELPEMFIDSVAFHHARTNLVDLLKHRALADAGHVASLFPHTLDAWNPADAEQLRQFLAGLQRPLQLESFLGEVQTEFNKLQAYFDQGSTQISLADLLTDAARHAADSATQLVGCVHQMTQEAIMAGRQVQTLLKQQSQLEVAASLDSLSGALNRAAFTSRGGELLSKAARYGMGMALAFFDLDRFKQLNDTLGHGMGDAAIRHVVDCLKQGMRQSDVVGRLGGDEFAILLCDCDRENATQAVRRILRQVAGNSFGHETARITLSAGMVWCKPSDPTITMEKLLADADKLMYRAKRAGGNRLWSQVAGGPAVAA